MDVGNPSNFVRILDLFGGDFRALTRQITGYSFTDDQTKDAMRAVYKKDKYVLDPHGAIGYLGLKEYEKGVKGTTGVFLETAHPAKFQEVVSATLGEPIPLPPALEKFMTGKKSTISMSNQFDEFKAYLLE